MWRGWGCDDIVGLWISSFSRITGWLYRRWESGGGPTKSSNKNRTYYLYSDDAVSLRHTNRGRRMKLMVTIKDLDVLNCAVFEAVPFNDGYDKVTAKERDKLYRLPE
jgi:hypothetical protein